MEKCRNHVHIHKEASPLTILRFTAAGEPATSPQNLSACPCHPKLLPMGHGQRPATSPKKLQPHVCFRLATTKNIFFLTPPHRPLSHASLFPPSRGCCAARCAGAAVSSTYCEFGIKVVHFITCYPLWTLINNIIKTNKDALYVKIEYSTLWKGEMERAKRERERERESETEPFGLSSHEPEAAAWGSTSIRAACTCRPRPNGLHLSTTSKRALTAFQMPGNRLKLPPSPFSISQSKQWQTKPLR
jgi:hypothetical protein